MKTSHLLLSALALTSAPAFAAPAETPVATTATAPLAPMMVPQLDAQAIALMDESVKAYAALGGLSQTFTVVNTKNGQPQPDGSFGGSYSGSFAFQRPGRARVEATDGEQNIAFVTDGSTFFYQIKPKEYQQQPIKRNAIQSVLSSMPSAADTPLSLLVSGRNPIADKSAPKWQSAMLTTKDGMPGVILVGPMRGTSQPPTYELYLDPQTKLLARVEVSAHRQMDAEAPEVTLSETTTFAPGGAVTPATFQYVPGPGVERFYTYDKSLVVGAKPFALTGKTLNDKTISLDNYKGRVVLLDFWATWCGPCRAELPNVLANYQNYHPWGFDIVGVSLDDDESEATLRHFVNANRMDWPQIYDGKGWQTDNVQTYGVKGIPFTLLLDKNGNIAAVNPRGEDLEPEIRAALMK